MKCTQLLIYVTVTLFKLVKVLFYRALPTAEWELILGKFPGIVRLSG
jgi:hypothetical protein